MSQDLCIADVPSRAPDLQSVLCTEPDKVVNYKAEDIEQTVNLPEEY